MRESNFINIKRDFKVLIKHAKRELENDDLSDELKGLLIITIFAAANSLYEKLLKHILKNNMNLIINVDTEPSKLLLLKYRDGRRLESMNYAEITEFILNINDQTIIESHFINDYKSLGKINEIKELLIKRTSEDVIDRILKKCKMKISFDNLINQLQLDYTDIRTKVIHGDYKNLKTVFYLWKDNAMPFLYRLYLVFNLINYTMKNK